MLKSCKIFSISKFSSFFKLASSLFNSKTEIGSINTVEPELEISCTNPLIWLLYSSLTGITYLSFLIVTTFSWIYFEYVEEWRNVFNFDFISCSIFLCFFLMLDNSFEALSSILLSSIIHLETSDVIDVLE